MENHEYKSLELAHHKLMNKKNREISYKVINYKEEVSNVPSHIFEVYIDDVRIFKKDYKVITHHVSEYIRDFEENIDKIKNLF